MPSQWLAVGAETDPLTRARQLQGSWERLLAEGALGLELPPEATIGLRPTIVESWRRSLATGLDPTDMVVPIEADQSEMRERWLEHPLGSLEQVIAAQLRVVAEESQSLVVVTDTSGLLLHIDGAEWLKERAREMNFLEGSRLSEAVDGTNGIGTALAADHPLQVFAFEHFNQRHHQWICSGAPVHDPVSGRIVGLIDLSSLWKIAHPRSLELVTAAARTMEQCLLDARRDRDARLLRRYSDLASRSTDLLLNRDGYVLTGDEPRHATPLDVPEDGGEIVLADGSIAVVEPLGQGEAYLVRRPGSPGVKSASVEALEPAEMRARELATEQAALRQVATLVARKSSPDQLFTLVAEQVARIFHVPLVRLVRYEPDGSVVLGGFSEGNDDPFPIGSRWPLDSPGVIASVRQSGRPARVEDYAKVHGPTAATVRRSGMRSAAASPIVVEGRLWGAMVIASPRREPLPEDTEARLTDFTELVATAIANAESHAAVGRLLDEQAALRRVATLVARGVSPADVFAAVTDEVGGLFGSEAAIARYEPDGSAMVVVGLTEGIPVVSIGARWPLEDFLASTAVYRTGRPARGDHTGHRNASGSVAEDLRTMDFVSTVAAPIVVEGNLWGVMTVSDRREPLPLDTEERVARFTELVATALANAESRAELAASEARKSAILESALDCIVTIDRGGRIIEFNPAAEATFGYRREDVLGKEMAGLIIPPALRERHYAGLARYLETGEGPILRKRLELRALRSDGTEFPVELTITPITVGDHVMFTGHLRDITDRKRSEEERAGLLSGERAARSEAEAARERTQDLAKEQSALRQVATLVAESPVSEELFSAVAREVASVLNVSGVLVDRFEPDGSVLTLGTAYGADLQGADAFFGVGIVMPRDPDSLAAQVLETRRTARVDDYSRLLGTIGDAARAAGLGSGVASPILVDGNLWGQMCVFSRAGTLLPVGTENRLHDFIELVATAISNYEAHAALQRLADEQAALRRVATLVAEGATPNRVLDGVRLEVARMFSIPSTVLMRFDADGMGTLLATYGDYLGPVGTRWPLEGDTSAVARVHQTGRAARADYTRHVRGSLAQAARRGGVRYPVAVPVVVEGALWGAMSAGSFGPAPPPPDLEGRLAKFTELVATALANAASRAELAASEARAQGLATEQAALRRVATLVAKGEETGEVFSAVAQEVMRVFGVQLVTVCLYEPDGMLVLSSAGIPAFPPGSRWSFDVPSLPATIYRTGNAERIDDFTDAAGLDALARDAGVTGAVGAPILVDGRVWGSINIATTEGAALEEDVEERLARFTDLIATSVSNATMRAELAASRARVIAAADGARRGIERDLHDGAQQQLVTLALAMRSTEGRIPTGQEQLKAEVGGFADRLTSVVDELREMSRGIHPAVLTKGGLSPALEALALRSAVPVKLDVRHEQRLPDAVEVAAYYAASEALTNASKHSDASRVEIDLHLEDASLRLSICDDGVGGADPSRGSGLIGLKDRVEALGGTIEVESPHGRGTRLHVAIPVRADSSADSAPL